MVLVRLNVAVPMVFKLPITTTSNPSPPTLKAVVVLDAFHHQTVLPSCAFS